MFKHESVGEFSNPDPHQRLSEEAGFELPHEALILIHVHSTERRERGEQRRLPNVSNLERLSSVQVPSGCWRVEPQ